MKNFIDFDIAKDRSDINTELRLDQEASTFLWKQVARIVGDINRHAEAIAQSAKGKNRREIIKYIKTLSRRLILLENHLSDRDANIDAVLRSQLGSRIGELLSNQAFEELIHQSPGYGVSSRFPPARVSERDDGLYRAWDREALERRVNIARRYTPNLLATFVSDLNRPLRRLLEVERQNKGGAPGKHYRNYVITELTPIYRQIYDENPRTTPEGKFATLCSLVLEELGMPIDGLESAIARRLGALLKAS
jgi:hypothetical protein